MALITLAVSGYRSLRSLVLPLERLNVVTGANGSGKSSLYRSLRLLADVAQGQAIASLAAEGGLRSTMWAGGAGYSSAMRSGRSPMQGNVGRGPVSLRLGFASEDYGYAIDLGLPIPGPGASREEGSLFGYDPVVKAEAVWAGERLSRLNVIARRGNASVLVQDKSGRLRPVVTDLAPFETMMMRAADPTNAVELLFLRERMKAWRFYDHFRIDRDAPSRIPRIGTRTVALASDGSDLAPAVQTVREIGDGPAFDGAIEDAFPGSSVEIDAVNGLFRLSMRQSGLNRALEASELSDGTLRYVALATALHTPRPPELMVLNEPEGSLHPDLLEPLARMIAAASQRSQIIVVSHAQALVEALAEHGAQMLALEKEAGETIVRDIDVPAWEWPER
ncbi:AAA family ATPase [Rhizobium rosettiformans]|uniref:AAA family ATPase n=1 Tax=Rhizobium rosettiformans TaxID=1368430 RepID=UPI0028661D01|nr:AAA family ATPase [Rhizobium rosettiformans]MDR7027689.1 putative ATPase [Rhizobium rosettiformans]MDR7066253.1 putative ATPase [Rhizobium rosettiformans]